MVLYIDGGCSGNNQRDEAKRVMVAVVTDLDGTVVSTWTGQGGSNNIAELIALRDALVYADRHGATDAEIYTDSQNTQAWVRSGRVGKQINDRDRVIDLLDDVRLLRQRVSLELIWVPRDENLAGHVIEARYGL